MYLWRVFVRAPSYSLYPPNNAFQDNDAHFKNRLKPKNFSLGKHRKCDVYGVSVLRINMQKLGIIPQLSRAQLKLVNDTLCNDLYDCN